MGAALATLGIFQFMGTWNDYLWPLIVITSTPKRTLPVMLTWYTGTHGQNRYDIIMAASFLVILPILVVYLLFQCWIVQGIALTGFR
jgi:multiple sugar transport system permease protein